MNIIFEVETLTKVKIFYVFYPSNYNVKCSHEQSIQSSHHRLRLNHLIRNAVGAKMCLGIKTKAILLFILKKKS